MYSRTFSGNDSNFFFPKLAGNTNDYHRNDLSGYYLNHKMGHKLRRLKQKNCKNCKN